MTSNPFNPSAANPRYLAGRDTEKAALADVLEAGAQSPVAVIYAPRGNGKTALAHWVERSAVAQGIEVRYRYARSCQTLSALAALLLNADIPNGEDGAVEAAAASYRGASRLLVIDEAQGLPPPILSALVTTAELSQGALSVVLVGTPLLHQRLHDIDPSLWAKCPVVALDPLDAASAADALRTPATEAGRRIDEAVLDRIVADSHGYPPFLQAWGANLWRLSTPAAPIGADVYEQAKPVVDFYRFSFYENRKEELAPYAESALEVASLFQETPVASQRAIYDAIRRGLPGNASIADLGDAFREFRNLGLFWRQPGAMGFYRPAIPSLMASIREGQDAAILNARLGTQWHEAGDHRLPFRRGGRPGCGVQLRPWTTHAPSAALCEPPVGGERSRAESHARRRARLPTLRADGVALRVRRLSPDAGVQRGHGPCRAHVGARHETRRMGSDPRAVGGVAVPRQRTHQPLLPGGGVGECRHRPGRAASG